METSQKKRNPWLSLAAVTLAFSFTFLSRYIWSPLMADVSGEFGINATQAGLYMSAFFAGYLVTQIPGGIMADKYKPKYILMICTALGGVMTAMMSMIQSYEMGLVIRVITGVSSGCVMAQCSKVVATTFEPRKRASAMGVVLASPPFGITLAQSLGAPLNQSVGWRNTFLTVAAVAVVIVAMIAVWVPTAEKKAAPTGSAAKAAAQTGMIITCYSIAGIAASCISGSLADKLHFSHRNFLILSLSLMGVMTLVFSFQTSYAGLIGVGIIYGAVSYLPSTHYTTSAMILAGERYTATAASSQNLLFQLASFIMPVVVGRAIDATGNYSLIWYIFCGCAVISVLFCFFVKNDK